MIVTNTMDSDDGLQVQLYVQRMRKVISQQVVKDAVNVSSVNWFCSNDVFSGISGTLCIMLAFLVCGLFTVLLLL